MLHLIKEHTVFHQCLAADLAEVETRFSAELTCDLSCVNDLVRHIERYRGKMLRPTLLLTIGRAASAENNITDEHITLATVIEMIHMGSLVHDDVLDESDIRRKGRTVNCLYGNEAAVMLGDFLISHAYHLCASVDSQVATRLVALTTNTACEGELLQLTNRNNWSLDEQTYFDIIHRKTASLVSLSCHLGAFFSGADKSLCDAMSQFGQLVGTAFQIIDDVLDLTGDPQVVGKTLGKDLEKGKLTLPLIHCLETSQPAKRQKFINLLRSDAPDRAWRIWRLLLENDSVEYAHKRAKQLIEKAAKISDKLPDTEARQMIQAIADSVVNRDF